jgi:hypothetical protein
MLWTISACYGRYHCPPCAGPAARPAPPAHPGWVVSGWVAPAAGPTGGVVRDRSSDATGGHGAELEPVESGDVRRRALVEHNEHMCSQQKPSADARIHGRAPASRRSGVPLSWQCPKSTTVWPRVQIDDSLASSAKPLLRELTRVREATTKYTGESAQGDSMCPRSAPPRTPAACF